MLAVCHSRMYSILQFSKHSCVAFGRLFRHLPNKSSVSPLRSARCRSIKTLSLHSPPKLSSHSCLLCIAHFLCATTTTHPTSPPPLPRTEAALVVHVFELCSVLCFQLAVLFVLSRCKIFFLISSRFYSL